VQTATSQNTDTWCPNCRQALPTGARDCECGARFGGKGSWQPLDAQGNPTLPPPPAGSLPYQEWRETWRAPGHITPSLYGALAWIAGVCALAGTLWLLYFLGAPSDWSHDMPDELTWATWGTPPLLWLWCYVARQQARLSRAARIYGAFEVSLRHEQNYPFTVSGKVRFLPPLSPDERGRDWRVDLRLLVHVDSESTELLAAGGSHLRFDADGRVARFGMRITLPDQLPRRRVSLELLIQPDGRKLYGMPINFREAVRFGIDPVG
jgi:hypothetical protein